MNTPAHGIELPRFKPVATEEFSVEGFIGRVEAWERELRERTVPKPLGASTETGAAVERRSTIGAEDPEFESGERATERGVASSFSVQEPLVLAASRAR